MDNMNTEEKQNTESGVDSGRFQKLLDTLDGDGVAAAIDCLIEALICYPSRRQTLLVI